MGYNRVFNFSSGPAAMPEPVLESIRDEMMNYNGTGMCVMEMSHRSEEYRAIARQTESDLRTLMEIPENYKVLFIQGGGTMQFSAVPINLMMNGTAVYLESGIWSKKAATEASRYGSVIIGASSKDCNYTRLPDCSNLKIPEETDYVYLCENETINGVEWNELPNVMGKPLVADQSSMFLSRECDVTKYGMIWAGVQKNVGPSGMTISIIDEKLINEELDPKAPLYLRYSIHAKSNSGYNTPNTWSVYCCGKVIKYLLSIGGLKAIQRKNEEKARILYDYLDSSKLFSNPVEKGSRSVMNIPFSTGDPERDLDVVTTAKRLGFVYLSGHPSVGGLRASLYNAMPIEGVRSLVRFLKEYEMTNR